MATTEHHPPQSKTLKIHPFAYALKTAVAKRNLICINACKAALLYFILILAMNGHSSRNQSVSLVGIWHIDSMIAITGMKGNDSSGPPCSPSKIQIGVSLQLFVAMVERNDLLGLWLCFFPTWTLGCDAHRILGETRSPWWITQKFEV